jgi:hypothetical protein
MMMRRMSSSFPPLQAGFRPPGCETLPYVVSTDKASALSIEQRPTIVPDIKHETGPCPPKRGLAAHLSFADHVAKPGMRPFVAAPANEQQEGFR